MSETISETRARSGEPMVFRSEKEMAAFFRVKFLEVLSVEDLVTIFEKLIEKAKGGSVQAAKMVFGFALGKQGIGGRGGYDEPISFADQTPSQAMEAGAESRTPQKASGEVTVEEVFGEPLRPEELRAARATLDATRWKKNLNGGKAPPPG